MKVQCQGYSPQSPVCNGHYGGTICQLAKRNVSEIGRCEFRCPRKPWHDHYDRKLDRQPERYMNFIEIKD